MAQTFLYPGGIVSLPREVVQRLLRAQNGDAALYYLALLCEDTATLAWPRERLDAAHGVLLSLSLVDPTVLPETAPPEKPEPATPPEYGPGDVAHALREQRDFPALVSELQRRLGKILSPMDLQTLLLLHDYLALPPEVILLLVSHCIETTQKAHGSGRKPTMNQIKKEAFQWQRLGVDSLERAETHLQALSQKSEGAGHILQLLDIGGRAPVEAERRYLDAWIEMGFDDDALRLAYEKTVLKKQSMSWPYMNSILRSWHQKGLRSKDEIVARERGGRPGASNAPRSAAQTASPPTQERLQQEFDRLDRLLIQAPKED